jgi:hypothetical protein
VDDADEMEIRMAWECGRVDGAGDFEIQTILRRRGLKHVNGSKIRPAINRGFAVPRSARKISIYPQADLIFESTIAFAIVSECDAPHPGQTEGANR